MEGAAHPGQKIFFVGESGHLLHLLPLNDKSEETIVRAYKEIVPGHNENRFPRASDSRINDSEVDRAFRKAGVDIKENVSTFFDIMGADLMADVHEMAPWVDT
jgi:hypothetical protein